MPLWSRGFGLSFVALLSVPFANADRVTNASEQGNTARQVIVASETAMKDVKSFHVVGMVGSKASASSFSLSLSATGGGGVVSVPGATLKLVVAAGTVYIRANEASWLKLTGSRSTAQLVANRWIKAPASNADFSSFAALTITTDFVAEFFPGAAAHISEAAGTITWHREKVIVLSDPQGDRLYVAATGAPYTLYVQARSSQDSLTFSEFGDAQLPAVPSNAISLPGT
jgi:hypothetical protein